jgi:DnaJ-domain-containing protein 1
VVIEVLYFSDKHVKARLFGRVTGAKKLTLVTVIPPHRASKGAERKEPFATLEREHGDVLDQVLVVDEGTIEGMWRDPVVDLADALFPSNTKAAYAAARGYFFVKGGHALKTVKKTGDADDDLHALREALSKLEPTVGAPKPRKPKRSAAASKTVEDEPAPAMETASSSVDAFVVLGIERGATLAEAKRAWRSLIVQYHPDKVAHLAPEFKALAEAKTREIMQAWEEVQQALGGDE